MRVFVHSGDERIAGGLSEVTLMRNMEQRVVNGQYVLAALPVVVKRGWALLGQPA